MIQEERFTYIMNLLEKNNSISVKDLADAFSVSAETVRSDIKQLEKMGHLTRIHGGAVKSTLHSETPHYIREISHVNQKKAIANCVRNLITRNDRIILDSSSTSFFVAQAIPNIHMTVLTNSVRIQEELLKKDQIEIVSTGGILLRSSMCFIGKPALEMLKEYHVTKAFISGTGIHPDMGVSEPNEMAISIKRAMISIADQSILLMDSSKFGVRDFIQVASIESFSNIYTDSELNNDQLALFSDFKDKIHICNI